LTELVAGLLERMTEEGGEEAIAHAQGFLTNSGLHWRKSTTL
jgi:hypothetical protein